MKIEYPDPDDLAKETPKPRPKPVQLNGDSRANRRLQGLAGKVATAPVGERNSTLNHAAYTAATIPGLDEATIRDTLEAAAQRAGLEQQEIHRTIQSGIQGGIEAGPDPDHREPDTISDVTVRIDKETGEILESPFRLMSAGEFLFDQDHEVAPVWGDDTEVIWSEGEPFVLSSKPGVGKTTLAGQLTIRRIGLVDTPLLGLPVAPDDRPVVYIAADRPKQIARSFLRMVNEDQRRHLDEQLIFHHGYLPHMVDKDPGILLRLAEETGCGTILVDSLKDIASKVDDPDSGTAINRAFQELVRENIQPGALHHQRKAGAGNRRPKTIDDVYGAGQITWGAGGVICLWGEPTDPQPEFIQLKKPAGDGWGPFRVSIDWDTGEVARLAGENEVGAVDWVGQVAKTGGEASARNYAIRLYGVNPEKADVSRASRKLERALKNGQISVTAGLVNGRDGKIYRPLVEVNL